MLIKQIVCNHPVAVIVVEVMTSGLHQVSNLWLLVSKGMIPVKCLSLKILMAVNYCGSQQAHRLGGATTAKKCTLHPGVCKHNLQYEGRSDVCLWMQVWKWNIGSLRGKGEVC